MRLSDLQDKKVRSDDGKTLGRVHEVHCDKGDVVAIMCGPRSFIERLTARNEQGRRIPWEMVLRVEAKAVVVSSDPPDRKPAVRRPNAARTRPGTRPASGRRSKR